MLYISMFSAALSFAGLAAAGDMESAGDRFFQNLSGLCGQTYVGRAVKAEGYADPFGQERLVMHVKKCTDSEIQIGFHVGEDLSRTWVVSRTDGGLQLKHIHLDESGEADEISDYGGVATSEGTDWRQEFPADHYSKTLFVRSGLERSIQNIWILEIGDRNYFAYGLTRPEYNVRVEFDLKEPAS